jgi:ubiquinone/menaquinone biosynthesis C-methylase UbiE
MEREIAHVMGHQGAGWLERPEREQEEKPKLLMELLELKPGMVVADIGAGSGYHTRRMARAVAPDGKVMAVDIQPEMLQILTNKLTTEGITNVVPILGRIDDPNLPEAAVDLVLMVDVYHEFSHPYEMMEGITRSLKPGGRVVFVEYRGEDKWVPIKEHHKMTEAQVKKEMSVQSLKWSKTVSDRFPWQHLIVFEKVEVAKTD